MMSGSRSARNVADSLNPSSMHNWRGTFLASDARGTAQMKVDSSTLGRIKARQIVRPAPRQTVVEIHRTSTDIVCAR